MKPFLSPAAVLLLVLGTLEPVLTPGLARVGAGAVLPSFQLDSDDDGVADPGDACPGTPHGYPVGANGCALDSDGDGVADGADQCPATRSGSNGVDEGVDPQGCSVRDRRKERDFPYSLGVG